MSQPAIDWQDLALKLSRPWWGKINPKGYVYRLPNGEFAGVGRVVGQNFGVWNLTLMSRGTYENPPDHAGHTALFSQFRQAKKVGKILIDSQPLESYAMLFDPQEFDSWLSGLTHKQLPTPFCQPLRQAMARFLKQTQQSQV